MNTIAAHPVLSHFGFIRMPFDKSFASSQAFSSPALTDALSMLSLGAETEDILLLTGPIGCGKSVALRAFIDTLDTNRFTPVYIRGLDLTASDLVKSILSSLLIDPPYRYAAACSLYFKSVSELQRKPVIVIDDAQDMHESALLAIKTLVNFDSDSTSRITFIICAQSELRETLRYSRCTALQQRIRHWIDFSALSLTDTCNYIEHSIKLAGRNSSVFSDNAKAEIHKRSNGIPRRINRICLRTLFEGAANKCSLIDHADLIFDDV